MWNTDFILPSLMVLTILLVFYFVRPRLPNQLNKAFLFLIISDVATIVTDYLSTKADDAYQSFPLPLVSALNLLYFAAYILRAFMFLRLAAVLFRLDREKPGIGWILSWIVLIAGEAVVLSSPFTGAVYTIDAAGYHRGPLYSVLPVTSFIFLFL